MVYYIKHGAPICMHLLFYLVLSHSQQGAIDCRRKVIVDPVHSKSYRVKGNCTFTPGNGTVEAISVSRVFKPSGSPDKIWKMPVNTGILNA